MAVCVDSRLEVRAQMIRFGLRADRRVVHGRRIRLVAVDAAAGGIAVVVRIRRRSRGNVSDLDRRSSSNGLRFVNLPIRCRYQRCGRRYVCARDGSSTPLTCCAADEHGRADLNLWLGLFGLFAPGRGGSHREISHLSRGCVRLRSRTQEVSI